VAKNIRFVTTDPDTSKEIVLHEGPTDDFDILFIDPLVWNIDDLTHPVKRGDVRIVRKKGPHWGRDTKGFYLLSVEKKKEL